MIKKDDVKNEIDKLSSEDVEMVNSYYKRLNKPKPQRRQLSTVNLGGKLDNKNIRKLAYE
ncbi:MAG: hypothetical protein WD491_13285 [Balneolales bacterium]